MSDSGPPGDLRECAEGAAEGAAGVLGGGGSGAPGGAVGFGGSGAAGGSHAPDPLDDPEPQSDDEDWAFIREVWADDVF